MFLLRIFYYGEGYWEDCDLHVPSCVSAPARWLPGVDSLLSPSLRREAGPRRSGDGAAGVPAEHLFLQPPRVTVDLCGLSLPQGGLGHSQERATCIWCAWRVILADAYTLGAGDLRAHCQEQRNQKLPTPGHSRCQLWLVLAVRGTVSLVSHERQKVCL